MRSDMSLQLLEGAARSLRVALGALSFFMDIPAGIIVTLYSLLSMAWSDKPSQVWDNIGERWGLALRSHFAIPYGLAYKPREGYFHYLRRVTFAKNGEGFVGALEGYPVEESMFNFLRTIWYFVVVLCVIWSWVHIGSFIASAFYGVAGVALGIALCSLLTYVIACCIRAESPYVASEEAHLQQEEVLSEAQEYRVVDHKLQVAPGLGDDPESDKDLESEQDPSDLTGLDQLIALENLKESAYQLFLNNTNSSKRGDVIKDSVLSVFDHYISTKHFDQPKSVLPKVFLMRVLQYCAKSRDFFQKKEDVYDVNNDVQHVLGLLDTSVLKGVVQQATDTSVFTNVSVDDDNALDCEENDQDDDNVSLLS